MIHIGCTHAEPYSNMFDMVLGFGLAAGSMPSFEDVARLYSFKWPCEYEIVML